MVVLGRHHDDRVGTIDSLGAQQVGLSLDEISAALHSLPEGRTPNEKDWHKLSASWRPRLDAQIAILERCARLDISVAWVFLFLGLSKIVNPDDQAGVRGPGPRYIIDG